MDQILHNSSVKVSLYIGVTIGLAVGCQPGGAYYRSYFVSAAEEFFVGEAIVADTAVAEALALRAHVPVGGGILLLTAALLELIFLV
jgi:hypothetical protein